MANIDLVVLGVVALVVVGAVVYLWSWFRGQDPRVRSDLQPVEDRPAPAVEPEPSAALEPEITVEREPVPVPEEPVRLVRRTEPAGAPEPGPAPALAPAPAPVTALKYVAPSNPETAELEKGDPRHAAARRLARLSVSEIKLYREADVKAGREAGDLWRRLQSDIIMALQMFEKRVDQDVRDRFDYFYDELVRQLAAGDASKLGIDAPARQRGNAR